jgi:serine/threonine-protein kinase
MPLMREQQLEELVRRWQDRRLQGETLSADDLCRDCPELADEIRQRIASLPPGDSNVTATVKDGTLPRTRADEQETVSVEGYAILERLGHGGMGIVWKAKQVATDRLVALKMLPASTLPDEHDSQRFMTEIHALGSLNHPNIVQIHDAGKTQGRLWYAMEYVPGGSLADRLERERYPIRDAAQLVETLARTIHAAHESGIIHRDLKPGNILLREDGSPKIADFGLARRLEGDPTRTPSGAVLGTPCYMSPEQASGKGNADVRSDVYSLGAILYELLTGRPPFKGPTPVDTMFDVIGKPAPSPRRFCKQLPRDIEAVCMKCLHKNPQQRYETGLALALDLARWRRGEPTCARPPGLFSKALSVLRRHPFLSLLMTTLLFLVGLLPVLLAPSDPDRAVAEMHKALVRGEIVPLLREDGEPHWIQWPFVPAGTFKAARKPRSLSLHTGNLTLATLIPSLPVDRYRLEGLIRHDGGGITSEVGLFVALEEIRTNTGSLFLYTSWTFNDLAEQTPDGNYPQLSFFLCKHTPTKDVPRNQTYRAGGGKSIPFQPAFADPDKEVWRDLALEVDGDRLRTYWGGTLVHNLGPEDIRERVEYLAKDRVELRQKQITFHRRGGLGLYLRSGAASFKSVTVRQLSEAH